MQYLLLVYTDDALLDGLGEGEFDTMMRGCLQHADALRALAHMAVHRGH